jgi:propionyl-CoA carboxylase alpha chain
MKRYQITLEGQTFDVHLLSDPRQEEVQVEIDGVALTAQVRAIQSRGEPGPEATETADSSTPSQAAAARSLPGPQTSTMASNAVTAPLPGVIKSIAVSPGQQVSSGDQLLVIEAMKMDNILRASRDGTIETIHVSEGHQVAYGERLLEYVKP